MSYLASAAHRRADAQISQAYTLRRIAERVAALAKHFIGLCLLAFSY
jgi:hypothetical protein